MPLHAQETDPEEAVREETEVKMATIELDIKDSVLFELMKEAHKADLTLNMYIEQLISYYLDTLEPKP